MKVINLIGTSNTGKSTTVYGLLYAMKKRGLKVEFASEYAKDMVWEKRGNILADQLYILAKQNRKLSRLTNIDFAVTDTSLLLGLVYAAPDQLTECNAAIRAYFNQYDNVVFYLPPNPDYAFHPEGRVQQSREESDAYQAKIEAILPPDTIWLPKSEDYVDTILEHLGLTPKVKHTGHEEALKKWKMRPEPPCTEGPHCMCYDTSWTGCCKCYNVQYSMKLQDFHGHDEIADEYSDVKKCPKSDTGYHCKCFGGSRACCICDETPVNNYRGPVKTQNTSPLMSPIPPKPSIKQVETKMATKYSAIPTNSVFTAKGGTFKKVDEMYYEDLSTGFQSAWSPLFDSTIGTPVPVSKPTVSSEPEFLTDPQTRFQTRNPNFGSHPAISAMETMYASGEFNCAETDYELMAQIAIAAVRMLKSIPPVPPPDHKPVLKLAKKKKAVLRGKPAKKTSKKTTRKK